MLEGTKLCNLWREKFQATHDILKVYPTPMFLKLFALLACIALTILHAILFRHCLPIQCGDEGTKDWCFTLPTKNNISKRNKRSRGVDANMKQKETAESKDYSGGDRRQDRSLMACYGLHPCLSNGGTRASEFDTNEPGNTGGKRQEHSFSSHNLGKQRYIATRLHSHCNLRTHAIWGNIEQNIFPKSQLWV